jgi:hypothetical protein
MSSQPAKNVAPNTPNNACDEVLSGLLVDSVPPQVEAQMRSQLRQFRHKLAEDRRGLTVHTAWRWSVPLAAAAAVLLAVGLYSWLGGGAGQDPSLLSKACAAENAALLGGGLVHLQNEIQVFPVSWPQAGDQEGPASTWLPVCTVKPDGSLGFNQLTLSVPTDKPYTVSDESWYDGSSGRFVRIIKAGESVVFANSFDGGSIYTLQPSPNGQMGLERQAISSTFKRPTTPAAFLGIGAGLPVDLKGEPLVQQVSEGKLDDGSAARVFQVGMSDANGKTPAYWLFKVRQDDKTLAQKEFVIAGRTQLLVRRVLTQDVNQPAVAWDLAGLDKYIPAGPANPVATVSRDTVMQGVPLSSMAQRADFQTYVLSAKPSWTGEPVLSDILDVASPPKRMFSLVWRADDGRHVVMVQAPSYNKVFPEMLANDTPVYTSPGGFRLHRNAQKEKWLANILLTSSRSVIKDPPAANCTSGLVVTPAGTVIALAVNGPVTEEELHSLVDNLVPAKAGN